ncbi:rRNA maturation RNase YbeY [Candidatus Kaiserbacteria bacterium RIFCSPHIGHO2_01_FULL_48_10]|uniref:Endoribonuclease YbeY n=1 Tax=Candidatus Kaiserbacteria bacterium RIFCSPHIGHO2_01_FULL_48_10 TaxID=1798476 RepID=A0A1F6C314_9BACT|nr:MAG: rRNA maturation RNase YbeY [Candidatus Kaiserbacteria bacterium RIFCSPHIGHO2_01_FULL_48_10]
MALLIIKKPRTVSRALFSRIHKKVLGEKYALGIIFVSPKKMQTLNSKYRKKNKPTDILSFALNKKSGELYLSLSQVKAHAAMFGMKLHEYLPYLVIHGMLHLKGLTHGRTMDRLETRYCRALRIPHPQNLR